MVNTDLPPTEIPKCDEILNRIKPQHMTELPFYREFCRSMVKILELTSRIKPSACVKLGPINFSKSQERVQYRSILHEQYMRGYFALRKHVPHKQFANCLFQCYTVTKEKYGGILCKNYCTVRELSVSIM